MPSFDTVLIANRGEIARRIIRTLRAEGVRSVAVYSDADSTAAHVREADVAVRLGPAPASESYLRVDLIVAAAKRSGAQAIHPGYGFLSESVGLARACADEGLVFIGPDVHALEVMGDKARARDHVHQRGVPVVPGFSAAGLDDSQIAARAEEIGFPLLVKPSAGGGGKGMEVVGEASALDSALASARRVAAASFGDDSLIVERLIRRPRHIEVQVFGDTHGNIIALGERECTLQRRHQKVVEEAPSAGLGEQVREHLLAAAVEAARSVSYVGAGTVEFLVDAEAPDDFFFIEMNTRLQVEHPVTEEVTGWDLVSLQLLVAAGGSVPEKPALRGHAVEARIYAEAPERGFLPSTGHVLRFEPPRGVRVDAAVDSGSEVTGFYDPMIAKIIAHGPDRKTALQRLDTALSETVILGVETNIAFLRMLCANERVQRGDMDTGLIETMLPVAAALPTPAMLATATALSPARADDTAQAVGPLWRQRPGWRMGADPTPEEPAVFIDDEGRVFTASPAPGSPAPSTEEPEKDASGAVDHDGAVWVSQGGVSHRLRRLHRRERMLYRLAAQQPTSTLQAPEARAPMPGGVVALHVSDGDAVRSGERLLSIEAMKMEHPVLAPRDGIVRLRVGLGEQVRRDQAVATIEVDDAPPERSPTEPTKPSAGAEHNGGHHDR